MPSDIVDEEDIRRLQMVKLCTTLEVQFVLQSSIVTNAADIVFQKQTGLFLLNPANTLPYIALRALEERSIVHLAEALSQKKLFPGAATIRKKMHLIMHRHSLSHPLTVKWDRRWMQEFFDQKRNWRDLRPALVWDVQRSLNDEFRRYGMPEENQDIKVTEPMAMFLELILKLSVSQARFVPNSQEIHEQLQTFKEAYLKFVLEHLDQNSGTHQHSPRGSC